MSRALSFFMGKGAPALFLRFVRCADDLPCASSSQLFTRLSVLWTDVEIEYSDYPKPFLTRLVGKVIAAGSFDELPDAGVEMVLARVLVKHVEVVLEVEPVLAMVAVRHRVIPAAVRHGKLDAQLTQDFLRKVNDEE